MTHPDRAERLRDVEAGERRDAAALDLENVAARVRQIATPPTHSEAEIGYFLPPKVKVRSGRSGILAQSTVYWPFHDLVAPISLFKISAMSVGSAMSLQVSFIQRPHTHEVPVSMAAPVFSSSIVSLPKATDSSSTSQYCRVSPAL